MVNTKIHAPPLPHTTAVALCGMSEYDSALFVLVTLEMDNDGCTHRALKKTQQNTHAPSKIDWLTIILQTCQNKQKQTNKLKNLFACAPV
jgi:hypothetical protein